jgi:hypothetical protein
MSHQSLNSNSKTKIEDFKFLYSVDQLTQLAIFENFIDSNQTLLPKDNLFPMDFYTNVKIKKIIEVGKYLFQGSKQSYTTQFPDLTNSSSLA